MTKERFEPLLVKHLSRLLLVAQQHTRICEDAEDLLQDTVLLLLERVESYTEGNFGAYCYTLLHNLYRNSTRRSHIIEAVEDLSLYDCHSEEHHYDYEDIVKSIEKLPPHSANAIKMYINGYHYDEIASQLQVSIGTVKSRISRARTTLQSWLKEYR